MDVLSGGIYGLMHHLSSHLRQMLANDCFEKSAVAKMLSFSVLICFCISAWFAGYLDCEEKSTPLRVPDWETDFLRVQQGLSH